MTSSSKIRFLVELSNTLAKSKRHVVYVAGKVTGLEPEVYKAKFAASKAELEAKGFHVLNPCDFVRDGTDWPEAMRFCLSLLSMADTIYLQEDWRDSPGAMIEQAAAVKMELNCIYQ